MALLSEPTIQNAAHLIHEESVPRRAPLVVPTMQHQASSVLLQGNPQTCPSNLFLFPGAFGTPDVFRFIPPLDNTRAAVFGLTSAFANDPKQFKDVSIPELAALYLAEIRRRQPHGPYSLLGYSVGGIVAYEVARQLIVDREAVERLFLIDSPCPLVIPPIPCSLLDFIDSALSKNRGGSGPPPLPAHAILHKSQMLLSLATYVPRPLPPCPGHVSPKVTYYVAKKGLDSLNTMERPELPERDQKVITWLLDDRKELGSGDGWERLVDQSKLKVVYNEGNHFSIMKEPNVLELAVDLRSSYWDTAFPSKLRSVRRRS